MILSDQDILKRIKKGDLKIKPFNTKNIQPSSLDISLSDKIRVFENWDIGVIDVKNFVDPSKLISINKKDGFIIHPGEFVLGATIEELSVPRDLVVKLEGRSSLGRLGLIVHATAGYIDPGFSGTVTLEISNIANLPIRIYPGMRIGQFSFYQMTSDALNPYGSKKLGSKYQGQKNPEASRVFKDFTR